MGHSRILGWCTACLVMASLGACSGKERPAASARMGLPEEAVPTLAKAPPFIGGAWSFAPLRPASREAELQILLFASGSPAFAAMVLPAPRVPFVEAWAKGIPVPRGDARPDLAASLYAGKGWKALPLEVSVPVLLLRKDLLQKYGLDAPTDLSALQRALSQLARSDSQTEGRMGSTLPMEALFWSLSWSGEGGFSQGLYTAEKVQTLRWLIALEAAAKRRGGSPAREFQQGMSAGLFTDPKTARECLEGFRSGHVGECVASAIPATGGPKAPNLGWCIVRAREAPENPGTWEDWTSEKLTRWLRAKGVQPAFGEAQQQDDVDRIVAATALCPELLPGRLIVIAEDAMDDAATGAASAEEALRRAQARIQEPGRD